ncbi:hypothetical protein EZV62_016102 [Acer yangbiense]|uniref:Probable cytosolic iron-sulfur protein assembly protein CIAO1 homolog n=1 Tax=Acer yangbiense TaxID=1000413 RepID=A0A5C7HMM9_9ROSI|nr:hypothetical protein EZV62_016102 [Acer yangbiense]
MEFFDDGDYELREIQKLEGHTDRVWCLSWNPKTGINGVPPIIASCSGDKTIRIWEQSGPSQSWRCKAVLEETHTRTVRSCAWSLCGKFLATGSFDATTAIWENIGGDYECVSTLEGHENEVKSVSWNECGNMLATCSRDKSVWIWEVLPGNEFECVTVLQGHTQDVKMVQWHPRMDIVFSCSYDNTIKVWWSEDAESENWECCQTIVDMIKLYVTLTFEHCGHSSTVWALSFNVEGDKMVSCSDDLTLKIWEANTLRMESGDGYAPWSHVCTLSGYHDRTIFSVHWSRFNHSLPLSLEFFYYAAVAIENRFFCCDKGRMLQPFPLQAGMKEVAGWQPPSLNLREGIIASGAADDAIRLFVESKDDSTDGPSYKMLLKKEKAHDMDVNSVQWNPVDHRLLASGSDDGTIKIWELASTLTEMTEASTESTESTASTEKKA